MNLPKNVIVTGGAGFIGSHLVSALSRAGYSVHVIDNLKNGKRENLSKDAQFYKTDIRDRGDVLGVFRDIRRLGHVHGVFHLAALPRVQYSIDHPAETHDVNVNGTINVLDASRGIKVGRFIYSASSSAYGDQDTLPLHEGMCPNPKSPYAFQKLAGEYLVKQYALHYGLPGVSLRYFNAYGPGASPTGSYPQAIITFIDQRSKERPLTVTGDGLQTRDSVNVYDIKRANILALQSAHVGYGESINIASGRNVSVLDMAKMIGGPIQFIASRVEPRDTKADIRKAKELLGWEPTITLEEGIAELKEIYGIKKLQAS